MPEPETPEMRAGSLLARDLFMYVLSEFKQLPNWSVLTEEEQEQLSDRAWERIKSGARAAVTTLATMASANIKAEVLEVKHASSGVVVKLKVGNAANHLHDLFDRVDGSVLLVLTEPELDTGKRPGKDDTTGDLFDANGDKVQFGGGDDERGDGSAARADDDDPDDIDETEGATAD